MKLPRSVQGPWAEEANEARFIVLLGLINPSTFHYARVLQIGLLADNVSLYDGATASAIKMYHKMTLKNLYSGQSSY